MDEQFQNVDPKERWDAAKRCFNIIINDLLPRLKKRKMKISAIPPELVGSCVRLEIEGKITRRETRKIIDVHLDGMSANG